MLLWILTHCEVGKIHIITLFALSTVSKLRSILLHLLYGNRYCGIWSPLTGLLDCIPWASCQIRKIAGYSSAGNAGNVFPATARVIHPDMHHGTCVTHVPWCMSGWIASGFLWSWWRGKLSRHSRRMRNPLTYVSRKRPMSNTFPVLCPFSIFNLFTLKFPLNS